MDIPRGWNVAVVVHVLLDTRWLSFRFHLLIWAQGSILVEPRYLGLLPSASELFPWRILMPHLHLGIVKGNGSLTL